MTKIDEILDGRSEITKIQKIEFEVFIYNDVVEAMKEYAELYAKKCLEIAANQADIHPMRAYNAVNKKSITKIKLPEHD